MKNNFLENIKIGIPDNPFFKQKENDVILPSGRIGREIEAGALFIKKRVFCKADSPLRHEKQLQEFQTETARELAREIYGPIIPALLNLRKDISYCAVDIEKEDELRELFNEILEFCGDRL